MTMHELIYYMGFFLALRAGYVWGYEKRIKTELDGIKQIEGEVK